MGDCVRGLPHREAKTGAAIYRDADGREVSLTTYKCAVCALPLYEPKPKNMTLVVRYKYLT
jgi:hypothetical protein